MPDQRSNAVRHLSPKLSGAVILLCCAGVVGGLGCATWFVSQMDNPKADAHFNQPSLTDTIFALAKPDDALAKKIGNQHAFAFLGKKHTYLLIEGGELLTRVAAELDGNKVVLDKRPKEVFLKGKTIWGTISLSYTLDQASPQAIAETSKLLALGFTPDDSGVYRLAIAAKGVTCPPAKVNEEVAGHFAQSREIAFYNAPDSRPPPDLGKLITVPLAVVVDVALTPVYLFGIVILVLGE